MKMIEEELIAPSIHSAVKLNESLPSTIIEHHYPYVRVTFPTPLESQ
jgi:hypothetical protein